MKQRVSRSPLPHAPGIVAVYSQEGAPLTDAALNEAAETAWTNLRAVIRDSGLVGTAGAELRAAPSYGEAGELLDVILAGGPGRFYVDGLPIDWPADLPARRQACACAGEPVETVLEKAGPAPVFVWVEARSVLLDESDLPASRDPAVQSERGSFRRVIHPCVRVADARDVPGSLVPRLLDLEAVAPLLDGLELRPVPDATNVRLTVQGAYASDENVHYHVELVAPLGKYGTYTHRVELLWDDRAASTVTRLAADRDAYARELEVESTEGFEPGHFVRLEGEGVDAQIYEVTHVDGYKLGIRRSLCRDVVSLCEVTILAHQVSGDPNKPASLVVTLVIHGGSELAEDDLVTDLNTSGDADPLPFAELVWQVAKVEGGGGDRERMITLIPHFGLTQALSPWGEGRALMQHARIHEHCVVVEEADCWQPGMKIRISGRPRKLAPDDPCWQPEDVDAGSECWPTRDPLFRDEHRVVTWIERCGSVAECCGARHTTMTLRLDEPLSADHSKCCDDVRPAREIKVRRYSGYECCAELRALWPCCEEAGGVCCLTPSFTLPSGLDIVLTYRGGTEPRFTPGDAWSFAARAGGWYERRVFAAPHEVVVGVSPLAMLVRGDEDGPAHFYYDIRPIPAAFDQSVLLAEIAESCAELAAYFAEPTRASLLRAAALARFPRLQINVRHAKTWQLGLVETLYRFARDFVRTHLGQQAIVEPTSLAKNSVLAVAIKALANAAKQTRHAPSLTNRELSALARALARAATTSAALLGGCCGDEGDAKLLSWPPLLPLAGTGPRPPPGEPRLPVCPDEQSPVDPGHGPACGDDDEPRPDLPPGRPDEVETPLDLPLGRPDEVETPLDLPLGEPAPSPEVVGLIGLSQPDATIGSEVDPFVDVAEPADPRWSIAHDPGIGELPQELVTASDSLAATPEAGEPAHAIGGLADLMELPTSDLEQVRKLKASTAHKIVSDWPRLGDAYAAESDGPARKRVIRAARRLVAELRALVERADEREVGEELAAIWSRHVGADVSPPPLSVIARSLPAPTTGAPEEE